MMEILKLVTLLLIYYITGSSTQSLPCRTASGDNCPSSICRNTVVTYTCTIPSGAAGLTDWTLPTGTCPSNSFPNKIRISQLVSQLCAPQGSNICGPYTASSGPASDATYCLSSNLTVSITAAMNGSTVTCSNTNLFNTSISTVVSLATINVVGPPGAPNVMAKTIGPDMVLVVVNPSSSGGLPTSYNVTISNSGYVYTKSTPAFLNGSAMVTFTGLTNTATYTISAVAINCAGSSNPSTTISVSCPPGAPNVMAKIIGPDILVVLNPSSSGGLPTSYNVTISNSSFVYTKSTPAFLNGSAMVTFTGLTIGIAAVAINCAGSSNPTTTYVSWPAPTPSPSAISPSPSAISPSPSAISPSPLPTSSTSITSPTSTTTVTTSVSTAVGITFSITFIMAFSLGVLVTICISCISKTRSKTTSPHPSTPNAPHEVVCINQNKADDIPLESNDAYGTVK